MTSHTLRKSRFHLSFCAFVSRDPRGKICKKMLFRILGTHDFFLRQLHESLDENVKRANFQITCHNICTLVEYLGRVDQRQTDFPGVLVIEPCLRSEV